MKDLCNESYKTLKKEIEDTRRLIDSMFIGMAKLIL
jgi:hypothetical protein